MSRIISSVLVFLLLMNGTVTIMTSSGLNEDLGVTLAPGIETEMNKLTSEMKKGFSPDPGPGDTLLAMFSGAISLGKILLTSTYAAPTAFTNLGFPDWIVYPLFAPMYLIGALYLVYLGAGRRSI